MYEPHGVSLFRLAGKGISQRFYVNVFFKKKRSFLASGKAHFKGKERRETDDDVREFV